MNVQKKLPNLLKGMSGTNNPNYQQMMKQLSSMTSGGNMKELLESMGGGDLGGMDINALKKQMKKGKN